MMVYQKQNRIMLQCFPLFIEIKINFLVSVVFTKPPLKILLTESSQNLSADESKFRNSASNSEHDFNGIINNPSLTKFLS